MNKDIPSFEAGIYELECFLEMGSHSITGQIKCVDGFMTYLLLFGIVYAEHCCRCED